MPSYIIRQRPKGFTTKLCRYIHTPTQSIVPATNKGQKMNENADDNNNKYEIAIVI